MLTITKFIEGGFDLITKQELPKSIVVSNGKRELVIPITEAQLKELVAMFVDDSSFAYTSSQADLMASPESKSERIQMFEPPESQVSDEEIPGDQMEDFEPGEEYSDSGTGVASL